MNRWSIRAALTAVGAVLVLLTVAVGALGVFSLTRASGALDEIANGDLTATRALSDTSSYLLRGRVSLERSVADLHVAAEGRHRSGADRRSRGAPRVAAARRRRARNHRVARGRPDHVPHARKYEDQPDVRCVRQRGGAGRQGAAGTREPAADRRRAIYR